MMDKNIAMQKERKHIAIFASGAGSNAQKIIDHFKIKNEKSCSVDLFIFELIYL